MAAVEDVGLGSKSDDSDNTDDTSSKKTKNSKDSKSDGDSAVLKPLLDDPNLPEGWSRKVSQRTSGASCGQFDVYIYSDDGSRFRSKTDLGVWLAQTKNKNIKLDDIDFTVYGKDNKKGPKRGPILKDLMKKMSTRARSKPEKEKKAPATPTVASKLRVKMNFLGGRKRKKSEDEEQKEEEKVETTPPTKRQKGSKKTPSVDTPKETPKEPTETPRRGSRARISKKTEEVEDTPKSTKGKGKQIKSPKPVEVNKKTNKVTKAATKLAKAAEKKVKTKANLKQAKQNEKKQNAKKQNEKKPAEKKQNEKKKPEKKQKEKEPEVESPVIENEDDKDSGKLSSDENSDLPKMEITQLDESPRKRRVSKKPAKFADEYIDDEPPIAKSTPKPSAPKATPKKKAPPKPKRKSLGAKNAPETPKRDKDLEDEVNLIASLTAQIEQAEQLVDAMDTEETQEPVEQEPKSPVLESPVIPSPPPPPSKPAIDPHDNVWTPSQQSSRYSGRKITPKIRTSPEDDTPTPRRNVGRGRGRGAAKAMVKRQHSTKPGDKKKKIPPPVPPKPNKKKYRKMEMPAPQPSTSGGQFQQVVHHSNVPKSSPTHIPPHTTMSRKPLKLSEDLRINSGIREQSYEEFLSVVESGSQSSDPEPTILSKKHSPKHHHQPASRTAKQRSTSESEIKLGPGTSVPAENVIHTPPPTSPIVPSDDHSYSLSSRKYPALSMPPRPSISGLDEVVPRFVSVESSSSQPNTDSGGNSNSQHGATSSEDEDNLLIPQQSPPPLPMVLSPTRHAAGVRIGRRVSSSEGGESLLVQQVSVPGSSSSHSVLLPATSQSDAHWMSVGEGQSVLAQVLSRPQEYQANKQGKQGKTILRKVPKSMPQNITQIVSKDGKVIYTGTDVPPRIRRISASQDSASKIVVAGSPTSGGPITLIRQTNSDGTVLVQKVAPQGFTRLSNIAGTSSGVGGSQRIVLTSPNKVGGASLVNRLRAGMVTSASGGSSDSAAIVTRLLSPSSSSGFTISSDPDAALVVSAPPTSTVMTTSSGGAGNIRFLYAGSSPPRSSSSLLIPHTTTTSSSQSAVITRLLPATASAVTAASTTPDAAVVMSGGEETDSASSSSSSSPMSQGLRNIEEEEDMAAEEEEAAGISVISQSPSAVPDFTDGTQTVVVEGAGTPTSTSLAGHTSLLDDAACSMGSLLTKQPSISESLDSASPPGAGDDSQDTATATSAAANGLENLTDKL